MDPTSAHTAPEPASYRLLIVEDDADIRQLLDLLLRRTGEYAEVRSVEDAETALAGGSTDAPAAPDTTDAPAPGPAPDLVLLDIGLPGMSGLEALPKFRAAWPDAQLIMLTIRQDDQAIFDALCAGADGYLLKDTPPERLLQALRDVRDGGSVMSPAVARRVTQSFKPAAQSPLSARETEILALLCDGLQYAAIGERLFLSGHTVRVHIRNIYRKLHVHSRAEAVRKALGDRLI